MKTIALLIVSTGLLLVTACDDDLIVCDDCDGFPRETLKQENLTQRWHVLNNVEYSYRQRQPEIYDGLLNVDFQFFFSPGDVREGSPEFWSRIEESDATTRLFLSNQQSSPPTDLVCRSIRLDIVYDRNSIAWVEYKPSAFPAETWYATTLFYTFTFEIEPNTTYIALNGARAEFVVRNNPQGDTDRWELVGVRDLGAEKPPESVQSTQEATWGAIKYLYVPSP